MNIIDHILVRSRVLSSCHVNSTKASFEIGAELIASTTPKLDARELLDALLSRERLGSTALGNGIAIPHCRSENCTHPSAALMHLHESVDFDGELVNLLFIWVVPQDEKTVHLNILDALSRIFGDIENVKKLRNTKSNEELFDIFIKFSNILLDS